ncbi:uncharacterized protein RJT20DRAFT_129981 [Scheffersomyces xylosifermentans]|uniref:uncharacterized protein n=1 Tax=Scheffersomyces xylosifermentans TaxID=1304137 RepID=UPI00315CE699
MLYFILNLSLYSMYLLYSYHSLYSYICYTHTFVILILSLYSIPLIILNAPFLL